MEQVHIVEEAFDGSDIETQNSSKERRKLFEDLVIWSMSGKKGTNVLLGDFGKSKGHLDDFVHELFGILLILVLITFPESRFDDFPRRSDHKHTTRFVHE